MYFSMKHPGFSQVMTNGCQLLADCYKGDTYDGHGLNVHIVPHDTDTFGYDRYREGAYPAEYKMIAQPRTSSNELRHEFRTLLSHCVSSLYRVEFKRCTATDCPLCKDHVQRDCRLKTFLERFPDDCLPEPLPMFPPFPSETVDRYQSHASASKSQAVLESMLLPRNMETVEPAAAARRVLEGHFRTFGDLLEARFAKDSWLYRQDFYRGTSKRIRCSMCRLPHMLRSDAAYRRHMFLMHECIVEGPRLRAKEPDAYDFDWSESDSD